MEPEILPILEGLRVIWESLFEERRRFSTNKSNIPSEPSDGCVCTRRVVTERALVCTGSSYPPALVPRRLLPAATDFDHGCNISTSEAA